MVFALPYFRAAIFSDAFLGFIDIDVYPYLRPFHFIFCFLCLYCIPVKYRLR
jgi:hypothetical protein